MLFNGVYNVFKAVNDGNDAKWQLAGRFMIDRDEVHILEDYFGLLKNSLQEGPMDQHSLHMIDALLHSSHINITHSIPNLKQPESSRATEVNPEEPPLVMLKPSLHDGHTHAPTFEYFRIGMDKPHVIEVTEHGSTLDGVPLDEAGRALILENLRNNRATIRYRKGPEEAIKKMEQDLEGLFKAENMEPTEALAYIKQAVKEGKIHPDVEKELTKHVMEDQMTGLGNKYAWEDFLKHGKPIAHAPILILDVNSLRDINDNHGIEAGNEAIKSLSNAIKATTQGISDNKVFRISGGKVAISVPTFEHAANFSRGLREQMGKLPPINGIHKLSVSIGIGHDPLSANQALYEAKKQKTDEKGLPKYQTHETPTLIHSLYPGTEGPVPIEPEVLPVI